MLWTYMYWSQQVIKKGSTAMYWWRSSLDYSISWSSIASPESNFRNGDIHLKSHWDTCLDNATYESHGTIIELFTSISKTLESTLKSLKASPYYSLIPGQSIDGASQEELSVCGCWIQHNKPVKHFLEIIQVKQRNAKANTRNICHFIKSCRNLG